MKRNALIIVLAMAMLLGCAIAGACGGGQGDDAQELPSGAATMGMVEEVANDAITISTAQGTVTVLVDEGTSIEKMGEGSLDDILPGENISVSGEEREDGSIDATQIFLTSGFMFGGDQPEGAGPGLQRPGKFEDGTPPAGAGTMGTVVTFEGNVVTLETRRDTTVSVVISDGTSIQKAVEGGLDDISPGKNVVVWGTQIGDGPIEALSISIIDAARFIRP